MIILMIGLGSIGQRHLRNIKKLFGDKHEIIAYRTRRLQQTFSDDMQICEGVELEKEYGLTVFSDISQALSMHPDVAYITNITSKHITTALECAKAGCDLFIEKPLSNTLEQVDELVRIANRQRLVVFLGFQNRYHICIKKAKQLLQEHVIGEIQSANSEYCERLSTMHTYEDYRHTYMAQSSMGGGPILTLQIHDFDLLFYLLGTPVSVYSISTKNDFLETDVENCSASIFTFKSENGTQFPVLSQTDFFQFPPSHKIKIVGEKGRIEIDLILSSLLVIVENETIVNDCFPYFTRNDMFIEETEDFFHCIDNRSIPTTDLEQGIVSLKMALAAKLSSEKNCCVSINTK